MKKYLVTALFLYFFSFLPTFAALDQWEIVTPPGASGYVFNTISTIDDYVFLGTDNGFYISSDKGTSWTQVNTGLTNLNITSIAVGWSYSAQFDVTADSNIFVGTPAGVFRNTISGGSWTAVNTGLNDLNVRDLELDQYDFTTLYAATAGATGATNGVYKSPDNGDTWTQTDDTGLGSDPIIKIASDFGDLSTYGYLYALSNTDQVYISELTSITTNPESWSNLGIATTTNNVTANNANGGCDWLSTSDGIYYSCDAGATWSIKNVGVTDLDINYVESVYTDGNIAYAASTGGGVYKTNDAGENWEQINLNLSDLNIKEIKNDPNRGTLVYAVGNDGVYVLELTDSLNNPIAVADVTAPSQMSLSITPEEILTTSVVLRWTEPGDDTDAGTASSYDIRNSASSINDGNWAAATQVAGEPTPQIAGSLASTTITGLSEGATYYFAAKASDEVPNTSILSTNVSATTPDETPPSVPSDLIATTTTTTLIGLSWSASTDTVGVTGYRIYKNGSHLSTTTNIFYTDSGLTAATSYSYFVDAYDATFNYSATSTTYATSTLPIPTCSSWTYSDWGTCQSNSTQTRTVSTSLPSGCTGGSPILSQSCSYVVLGGGGGGGGGGGATIDSNAPVRSLISSETSSPFSGIVAINLTTNENATCRYSNTAGNYYSSMFLFNETGNLAHKAAVSGLELNKSYTYYTKCQDASGNTNPDDLSITFSLSTSSASSTAVQLLSLRASTPTQTTNVSSASAVNKLIGPLKPGDRSTQVTLLQQILATDKAIYPEGTVTGFYGNLTTKAVERFQCKYLLICSGSPSSNGYGLVGPKTTTKINEFFSGTSSSTTNGSSTLSEQQLVEKLKAQIKALQEQIVILLSKLSLALQSKGVN